MASNADLITAAKALGEKLGEEVDITGLKNTELVSLVSGLRARADAEATVSGAAELTAGLVAQVNGLAEALGAPVATDGLSDEALTELISNMSVSVDELAKAVATDDEATAAADAAADREAANQEAADAKAVAAQEKPPFYLLPGKSITSKRGIIGPGEAVTADDLPGGQATLDARVDSGHIGRG